MQATRHSQGCAVDYTPGSAVTGGNVVVQNSLVGVAPNDIAANALGALEVDGIFDVVKETGAINAGNAVYWKAAGDPVGGAAGTGAASGTSTGNTFTGYAVKTAASGDATVRVLLVKPVAINQPLTNTIADPGNGGAIAVTNSGSVDIVTAGAETRTLAAPTFRGQEISIGMKTDGGDGVITVATGVNQTGNNTITLNDAGDSLLLVAIQNGANLRWRVAYNDGATLATV